MRRLLTGVAFAASFALVLAGCEGTMGPIGKTGAKGDPGAPGVAGAKGDKGETGAAGAAGAAGAPGAKGDKGDPGAAGTAGTNGKDGVDGAPGAAGAAGAPGAKGDKGDPGNVASAKGLLAGTVTATTGGAAVSGALVHTLPLDLTTTTDANGAFTFKDLPVGAYTVSFTATGFLPKSLSGVGVVALSTTNIVTTLDTDPTAGQAPTIVVTGNPLAGFGKPVSVKATVTDADTPAASLKFAWTQTAGTPVTFTGGDTDTIAFTTKTIDEQKPFDATKDYSRFDVLGLNNDDTGHYVFQLSVTDDTGHVTKASVIVEATFPTSGIRNVPILVPVYLSGAITPTASGFDWAITSQPATSKLTAADLIDAKTQYPHFTPDVTGTYVVTEKIQNVAMNIYGAKWLGIRDNNDTCLACHNDSFAPDEFTPWMGTQHFKGPVAKIDGEKGQFTQSCLECHTVGYAEGVKNGNFWDVQQQVAWIFNGAAPGTFDDLKAKKPALEHLFGVQCESCHGPQDQSQAHYPPPKTAHDVFARANWGAQVCARCHQEGPNYYFRALWAGSLHNNLALTVKEATWENNSTNVGHCGRCHSAQGYGAYADQLNAGNPGYLTKDGLPVAADKSNLLDEKTARAMGLQIATVQTVTCQACHDPHDATNPFQLRVYDKIAALPNGLVGISGVGEGATCMACHNTRNGEHTDFVAGDPPDAKAPHSPTQTDTLFGFNAYFVPRFTVSPHLAIAGTCATCHVATPTATEVAAGQMVNHAFKTDGTICKTCHLSEDVDGVALQAAYDMQLGTVRDAIGARGKADIAAALLAGKTVTILPWNPATKTASTTPFDMSTASISGATLTTLSSMTFQFHLAAPVSVTFAGASTPTQVTDLYFKWTDLKVAGVALYDQKALIYKAFWNYQLLFQDGSRGIHNPPFYNAVIAATVAKLK